MNIDRRRMLGALALGAAGAVLPSALSGATLPLAGKPLSFPLGTRGPLPDVEPLHAAAVPATNPLLERARNALARHARMIPNRDVIGLVDFSQASREPRFQLVEPDSGKVLETWLVAHGSGSDPANRGYVERFSNRPGSNASSPGSFVTAQIYTGKHGRSRRLMGLDPENSLALERDIVIHAASYVSPQMAANSGRVGRSQGCFAVSQGCIGEVLDRLGPGRLLFAWK